jgi:hypothetical protein
LFCGELKYLYTSKEKGNLMPAYRPPIAIAPPGVGADVWRPPTPTPRPGAPPTEAPPIVGIQIPPSEFNEILNQIGTNPVGLGPIELSTPPIARLPTPILNPPAPPTANPPRPPIELPTPIWGPPTLGPWEFWNPNPPPIRRVAIPL